MPSLHSCRDRCVVSLRPTPRAAWPTRLLALLLVSSLTVAAAAQCQPQWLPGDGFDLRGGAATDVVHAIVELPNGDLVIGGQFTSVAGVAASNIARWNGNTWSPLGSGIQGGVVQALAVLPNGDLVAGGFFTTAGAVAVNKIARWDGAAWSSVGGGVSGTSGTGGHPTGVLSLAVMPTGTLVAGGHFTTAGGVSAMNVAQWNGSLWAAMGGGLVNAPEPPFGTVYSLSVAAMAVRPNGTLVAGTDSAYLTQARVMSWDGLAWSGLTSTTMSGGVQALASLPNNDVLAAIWEMYAGLTLRRWNGTTWSTFGYPSGGSTVRAFAVLGNGDVVCGGNFTSMGGVPAENLARWNGVAWTAFGGVSGEVRTFASATNGLLLAGGSFGPTSAVDGHRLARWGCGGVATATQFGRGCYWRATSFYEHFSAAHAFDLDSSTLQLSPTPTGYDVVHLPGAPSFLSPSPGTQLSLTDDSVSAPIPLPFTIPYPGGSTNQIVVGSNGYVFLQPSTNNSPFYGATNGLMQQAPRHAALWGDLDPAYPGSGSGTIHFEVTGQTAYATWLSVREFGATSSVDSTFQIAMSSTGTVEYRYQQCDHNYPVLTGWSPGFGAQDPTGRDLSTFGPFSTTSTMFRLPLLHAANQRPKLGTSVTLTTSRLDPASVLGINLIGFTRHDPGIELSSLGMPDCYLFTSLDLMFPFFPAAQSGSHTIAIPNQASLTGFELHAQGVAWDFPANAFGMVSSNGLTLRLGSP